MAASAKFNCPSGELKILVLGESGVGKSTFINAIANYVRYDDLQAAVEYASQYKLHYPAGNSSDKGNNQCQGVHCCQIPLNADSTLCMYDTTDEFNWQHLIDIPPLHAICILLKPEMSSDFNQRIESILSMFDLSSCNNNIIFILTKTFDSTPVLSDLKKFVDNCNIKIAIKKNYNIFCINNSSFCWLSEFNDKTSYDTDIVNKSWIEARNVVERIVAHAASLKLIPIGDSVALNVAKGMLSNGYRLLTAWDYLQDNMELLDYKSETEEQLLIPVIDVTESTDGPAIICTSCKEILEIHSVKKYIYKVCHQHWESVNSGICIDDKCGQCQCSNRVHIRIPGILDWQFLQQPLQLYNDSRVTTAECSSDKYTQLNYSTNREIRIHELDCEQSEILGTVFILTAILKTRYSKYENGLKLFLREQIKWEWKTEKEKIEYRSNKLNYLYNWRIETVDLAAQYEIQDALNMLTRLRSLKHSGKLLRFEELPMNYMPVKLMEVDQHLEPQDIKQMNADEISIGKSFNMYKKLDSIKMSEETQHRKMADIVDDSNVLHDHGNNGNNKDTSISWSENNQHVRQVSTSTPQDLKHAVKTDSNTKSTQSLQEENQIPNNLILQMNETKALVPTLNDVPKGTDNCDDIDRAIAVTKEQRELTDELTQSFQSTRISCDDNMSTTVSNSTAHDSETDVVELIAHKSNTDIKIVDEKKNKNGDEKNTYMLQKYKKATESAKYVVSMETTEILENNNASIRGDFKEIESTVDNNSEKISKPKILNSNISDNNSELNTSDYKSTYTRENIDKNSNDTWKDLQNTRPPNARRNKDMNKLRHVLETENIFTIYKCIAKMNIQDDLKNKLSSLSIMDIHDTVMNCVDTDFKDPEIFQEENECTEIQTEESAPEWLIEKRKNHDMMITKSDYSKFRRHDYDDVSSTNNTCYIDPSRNDEIKQTSMLPTANNIQLNSSVRFSTRIAQNTKEKENPALANYRTDSFYKVDKGTEITSKAVTVNAHLVNSATRDVRGKYVSEQEIATTSTRLTRQQSRNIDKQISTETSNKINISDNASSPYTQIEMDETCLATISPILKDEKLIKRTSEGLEDSNINREIQIDSMKSNNTSDTSSYEIHCIKKEKADIGVYERKNTFH